MSAVKHAFEKIGDGIKHGFEGIGHAIEGAAETIGGALTASPSLMKKGANEFTSGLKQTVSGAGEIVGGELGAFVGMTPLGAALNSFTHGAASRLAEGVGDSAADIVNTGFTGAEDMVGGAVTGNGKEFLNGLAASAETASYAIPGAGEEELAARMATSTAKNLVKNSAENSAENFFLG
jgi:hypothetical protein